MKGTGHRALGLLLLLEIVLVPVALSAPFTFADDDDSPGGALLVALVGVAIVWSLITLARRLLRPIAGRRSWLPVLAGIVHIPIAWGLWVQDLAPQWLAAVSVVLGTLAVWTYATAPAD